ncbi:acetyltransferase, partial [Rheinheimera mesophila]
MKNIIIYGAGSFAKMMRLYLERIDGQKVIAFCVDRAFLGSNRNFDGLPVIAFEEIEQLYPNDCYYIFVAVGYSNMRSRKLMYERAKFKGYKFVNYIDGSAIVDETVVLGNNNIVLLGTIIEQNCIIGDNNIFWSSVVISHDVAIDSHCFFASKSLVGGNCQIGDNCFFGFNSVCVQDVVIGKESLIGA